MPDEKILPSTHKGAQSYELAVQWSLESNTPARIEKNLETLNTAIKLAAGDVDQLFRLRDQAEWYQDAARVASKVMDVGNIFMEANALVRKAEWTIAQEDLKKRGPAEEVSHASVRNSDTHADQAKRSRIRSAYKDVDYPTLTEMLDSREPGEELTRKAIETAIKRQKSTEKRAAERANLVDAGRNSRADSGWSITALDTAEFEDVLERRKVKADIIVTAPAPGMANLGRWDRLGSFAAEVLKPDGLLLAIADADYMHTIQSKMKAHLKLRCLDMVALLMGSQHTDSPSKYRKDWQPALLYGRADYAGYGGASTLVHEVQVPKDDERYATQPWKNTLPTLIAMLKQFSAGRSNLTVVDPFVNSGVTGAAAVELGWEFRGNCAGEAKAAQARGRIEQWAPGRRLEDEE